MPRHDLRQASESGLGKPGDLTHGFYAEIGILFFYLSCKTCLPACFSIVCPRDILWIFYPSTDSDLFRSKEILVVHLSCVTLCGMFCQAGSGIRVTDNYGGWMLDVIWICVIFIVTMALFEYESYPAVITFLCREIEPLQRVRVRNLVFRIVGSDLERLINEYYDGSSCNIPVLDLRRQKIFAAIYQRLTLFTALSVSFAVALVVFSVFCIGNLALFCGADCSHLGIIDSFATLRIFVVGLLLPLAVFQLYFVILSGISIGIMCSTEGEPSLDLPKLGVCQSPLQHVWAMCLAPFGVYGFKEILFWWGCTILLGMGYNAIRAIFNED